MSGGANPPRPKGEGEALPELTVEDLPPAPPGGATLAGLLGERYRTTARLGAGAFGEVYRAHDAVLGRDVAIKRIRLEAFVEPAQLDEVKKRFFREAQVAARLRHPNIVTTHDIVTSPATSFIVMELVEGQTLQSLLQARGRLGLAETIDLVSQVASALDHAHASQVVHRDIKPANIMIEPSGHVKVMDFGIAKAETGANLTTTGLIMGTPNYMSPEQARGQKVDARSDLFSLGCVLYECLTGVKPFQSDSVSAILVKILTEEPPPVDPEAAGLPRGIDPVLRKATAKDPGARFASGAEMIEALRLVARTTMGSATAVAAAVNATATVRAGSEGPATAVSRVPEATSAPAHASVSPGPRPATVSPPVRNRMLAAGTIGAVLVVALLWLGGAFRSGAGRVPSGGRGALVVEEEVGFLGRLLGRTPRLRVTIPAGTSLRLALQTPLSSETTVTGEEILAETANPVRIEGIEAVPAGSRLTGRVSHAVSAAQAGGRGEMTLEFQSLELPDEGRMDVRTKPLGLRAPASRRKDNAVVSGLAQVGAAVGELLGGRKGAAAGTVVGGAAGVAVVTTDKGREVALAARASLTIELVEPVTVSRPKPSS